MCDPASASIILGSLQAGGGMMQGKAQRQAAEYSATILDNNAKIDELAGADAQTRGGVEASRSRMQTDEVLGKQTTAYAASGVRVDTGSPVDVAATTRGIGELDAATIENNAAREAWGYQVNASNKRAQAQMARATGQAQETASLLTGYTRAAGSVMGYRRGT